MKLRKNRGLRLNDDLVNAIARAAEAESVKREVDVSSSVIIRTAIVEYLIRNGHLKPDFANE